MKKSSVFFVALSIFLISVIFEKSAYAYLDPGTGSFVLQILAATLLSSLFLIKRYWRKIKNLVFKKNKSDEDSQG